MQYSKIHDRCWLLQQLTLAEEGPVLHTFISGKILEVCHVRLTREGIFES